MFFYRTHNGAECDLFCITNNNRRLAIEINVNNSPAIPEGFQQSITDLQAQQSFVIVPYVTAYTQANGITIISLPDFLVQLPFL